MRATLYCVAFCAAALGLALWSSAGYMQDRAEFAQRRAACGARMQYGVPPSRVEALSRGFNLTGWLDQAQPRRPDTTILGSLRSRGFTHIRLPVKPELLMPQFSQPGAVSRQLKELDGAIEKLLGLGFAVSLDMHPGDTFARLHLSDQNRAVELLETLWRMLAHRYAKLSPERLFFEVLNEPNISARIWAVQWPRLVGVIRSEAPEHTIIYGPTNYQTVGALSALTPLADPNIVYAVHFYQPMIFTHQGLDWGAADDPLRFLAFVPFPAQLSDPAVRSLSDRLALAGHAEAALLIRKELISPWTEARIASQLNQAAEWASRYQRPVILNEFGALSWKAAPADRARWLEAVRRAAEHFCMGWTHWDYADGFGFVRRIGGREEIDEPIARALIDD